MVSALAKVQRKIPTFRIMLRVETGAIGACHCCQMSFETREVSVCHDALRVSIVDAHQMHYQKGLLGLWVKQPIYCYCSVQ